VIASAVDGRRKRGNSSTWTLGVQP